MVKSMKKAIAVLISILMVITAMPFTALAATDSNAAALKIAMSEYEKKMNGTVYKNMTTAYNAYVAAQTELDKACRGESANLAGATTDLVNATAAMTNTWSAYTGTKQTTLGPDNRVFGDFDNNSNAEYQNIYKNILYIESSASGINANSMAAINQGNVYAADSGFTLDWKFFWPNATLLYDGTTAPQIGAMLSIWGHTKPWNWGWGNIWLYGAMIRNTTDIGFVGNWKASDGRLNHTWLWAVKGPSNMSGTTVTTNSYHNNGGQGETYYANVIKVNKEYTTSDPIMTSYQPQIRVKSGSDQKNTTQDLSVTSNRTIRVFNYKKVIDTINSKKTLLSNVENYKKGGLSTVIAGFDMATVDPNEYFKSSDNYSGCQANFESAVSNLNAEASVDSGTRTHADSSYTWTTTQQATCIQAGSKSGVCKYCGETTTQEIPVNSANHTKAAVVDSSSVVAPTCTVAGKEADMVCPDCHTVITPGASISAKGHTLVYTPVDNKTHKVTCQEGDRDEVTENHVDENSDNACDKCNQALNVIDYTAYNAAVEDYNTTKADDQYTEASVAKYIELVTAQIALKDSADSQDDINAITSAIISAKAYLTVKSITVNFLVVDENGDPVGDAVPYKTAYGSVVSLDAGTDAVQKWVVEDNGTRNKLNVTSSTLDYIAKRNVKVYVHVDTQTETVDKAYSKVSFIGKDGMVVAVEYVAEGESLNTANVKVPVIPFYNATAWNVATVIGTGKDIYVVAKYTPSEDNQRAALHLPGGVDKEVAYDKYVYVESDKKLALSIDGTTDGIIAYLDGKDFYVPHVAELWVIEVETVKPMVAVTGSYARVENDKKVFAYNAKFNLPENATLVEYGVTVTAVTASGQKTQKIVGENISERNEYTIKALLPIASSVNTMIGTAYVVYVLDGTQHTMYSDSVTNTLS